MEEVKQSSNDNFNHEEEAASKQSHPKIADVEVQEKIESKKSSDHGANSSK